MQKIATGAFLVALLVVATSLGAKAQQVVETSTGVTHNAYAGHQCVVSQAMLAAIENGNANAPARTEATADARAKLNALLDSALAGTKSSPLAAQLPVVFPPFRSGS